MVRLQRQRVVAGSSGSPAAVASTVVNTADVTRFDNTVTYDAATGTNERLIPLAHPAGDGPVVPEVTGSIVVEEHGGTLAAFGAK